MFRRMNPGLKGTSDDVVREEMSRTEFGLNQPESLDDELMVVARRKGTNN